MATLAMYFAINLLLGKVPSITSRLLPTMTTSVISVHLADSDSFEERGTFIQFDLTSLLI